MKDNNDIQNKNNIKISYNVFVVKNQNGFNNSIYEFMYGPNYNNNGFYTKKELREMINTFPEKYPALVIFEKISEISRINVSVLYENEILKILGHFEKFNQHGRENDN